MGFWGGLKNDYGILRRGGLLASYNIISFHLLYLTAKEYLKTNINKKLSQKEKNAVWGNWTPVKSQNIYVFLIKVCNSNLQSTHVLKKLNKLS